MHLSLREKLGNGSFGEVFVASYRGKKVAVKSSFPSNSAPYKFLRSEKSTVSDIAFCEHVVSFLGDAHSIDKDDKIVYH